MKNAPDITLISIAERLSREKSLFAQSQLLDLSNTQAAMQGQKSALEPSLERLTGDGFFRSGPDGFLRTDRTDRWMAQVGRALSNPERTNPRAGEEGRSDLSQPMNQPQRYNIIDTAKAGGIEKALHDLMSTRERSDAVYIHGDDGPDIARFPLYTPNMTGAANFVGRASKALVQGTQGKSGLGPDTVLVISDAAFRSAHRAALVATAVEALNIGKVLVLAEPDKSSKTDLFVLREATRLGAASDLGPLYGEAQITKAGSGMASLIEQSVSSQEVKTGTVEQAAAAAYLASRSDTILHAANALRQDNLNTAVQTERHKDSDSRASYSTSVLRPVQDGMVNYRSGAGLREGDVLQVSNAPENSGYDKGQSFTITNVKPLGSTALAKDEDGRYVTIPLGRAHEVGVVMTAYRPQPLKVMEGDKVRTAEAEGTAAMVNSNGFMLQADTGRSETFSAERPSPDSLALAYTSLTPAIENNRAFLAVAGSADQTPDGASSPGAAAYAVWSGQARGSDARLFTDNRDALLANTRTAPLEGLNRLQSQFLDANKDLSRQAAPILQIERGDRSR